MKKLFLAVLSLMSMSLMPLHAAGDTTTAKEKFYGKIVSIDHSKRNLTVHNARQNMDAEFKWDDKTGFTSNKKPVPATELKVGQSLYIAFITENDAKKATYVSVRSPFKKSAQ